MRNLLPSSWDERLWGKKKLSLSFNSRGQWFHDRALKALRSGPGDFMSPDLGTGMTREDGRV